MPLFNVYGREQGFFLPKIEAVIVDKNKIYPMKHVQVLERCLSSPKSTSDHDYSPFTVFLDPDSKPGSGSNEPFESGYAALLNMETNRHRRVLTPPPPPPKRSEGR
jgi:hypothetical protein